MDSKGTLKAFMHALLHLSFIANLVTGSWPASLLCRSLTPLCSPCSPMKVLRIPSNRCLVTCSHRTVRLIIPTMQVVLRLLHRGTRTTFLPSVSSSAIVTNGFEYSTLAQNLIVTLIIAFHASILGKLIHDTGNHQND